MDDFIGLWIALHGAVLLVALLRRVFASMTGL